MPKMRPTAVEEVPEEKQPLESPPVESPHQEEPPHLARFLADGFPNPKAMNIWEYMQELTEDQWQHHVVYMYRTNPRMERVAGKPGYLLCCSEALTVEDIRQKYGGLGFSLRLNRRGENGKEKSIYRESLAIEAPPKFQSGETPENGASAKPAAAADPAGSAAWEMLQKLLSDVLKQRDAAVSQGRQFNPQDAFADALKIHDRAAEAGIDLMAAQFQKISSGGGNPVGDKMVETLLPLLIKKAFDTAPVQDPLQQFTGFLKLYKELQGEAPAASDGPANWKVALAQSLGGKIDMILERVEKTVGNYARAQEHRAAVMLADRGFEVRTSPERAAAGPVQTSATPTASPAGHPDLSSPPAAGQTERAARGEFGPPVADPRNPALPMGDFIKGKLVEMLFAGKQGDEGAIVAENLEADFAEQIARTMKENPSALATDNILAQAVRHPNAQKFCEAYVGYFEAEEEPAPAGTVEEPV